MVTAPDPKHIPEELDPIDVAEKRREVFDITNIRKRKGDRHPIVALGDSWFDYQPAGFDILDFLSSYPKYAVIDHGIAGSEMEELLHGPFGGVKKPSPLDIAIKDIERYDAKIFLVSMGGNDVGNGELRAILDPRRTASDPINEVALDRLVNQIFRSGYEYMIKRVHEVDEDVDILIHGYDYAVPNGEGVRILRYPFLGPWLKPQFLAKGWIDQEIQTKVIRTLIDRLNALQAELAAKHERVHHIDLRGTAESEKDWDNELHLRNKPFRRASGPFHWKILELLGLEH